MKYRGRKKESGESTFIPRPHYFSFSRFLPPFLEGKERELKIWIGGLFLAFSLFPTFFLPLFPNFGTGEIFMGQIPNRGTNFSSCRSDRKSIFPRKSVDGKKVGKLTHFPRHPIFPARKIVLAHAHNDNSIHFLPPFLSPHLWALNSTRRTNTQTPNQKWYHISPTKRFPLLIFRDDATFALCVTCFRPFSRKTAIISSFPF